MLADKTRQWKEKRRRCQYNRSVLRSVEESQEKRPTLMIMSYSLYGGGAERVASILASGFAKKYHVILLYIEEKKNQYPLDPSVEKILMPSFGADTLEDYQTWQKRYVRQVKRKKRVRISLSMMYQMNKWNVETKGHEIVICAERNNPAKREPENMETIRKLYEKADHVVFQTAAVRDLFGAEVKAHSSILPNPIEVSCMCTQESLRIVHAGRLNAQKDQETLLRAFALFHRTHSAYILDLYGDGEKREELQQVADALGIGQSVLFHGNSTEIHRDIKDAQMFVLSSRYEGFSNALLECMMMGMACISTNCEGAREVIQNGINGLLVRIGDPEGLSCAMQQLADDPLLRKKIAQNGQDTAKRFQKEAALEEWMQMLAKLEGEQKWKISGKS